MLSNYALANLLILFKVDKVINDNITQVLVNDPVHELEACEGDREENATVLVNV